MTADAWHAFTPAVAILKLASVALASVALPGTCLMSCHACCPQRRALYALRVPWVCGRAAQELDTLAASVDQKVVALKKRVQGGEEAFQARKPNPQQTPPPSPRPCAYYPWLRITMVWIVR